MISIKRTPGQEAFMAEYMARTRGNALAEHERFWFLEVGFEVKPFDGRIRLSCIRTLHRGRGHGSEGLDWLCRLADKHGCVIRGTIHPVGEGERLTAPQLRAWYKRHGFTVRGREIEYQPKGETC
jgi:GNAT superfamily N-acetyltransferase